MSRKRNLLDAIPQQGGLVLKNKTDIVASEDCAQSCGDCASCACGDGSCGSCSSCASCGCNGLKHNLTK